MSKKMSYAEPFDIASMLSWNVGFCYDSTDAEYSGNIMLSYVAMFYRSGRFKLESRRILKNIEFLIMEIN